MATTQANVLKRPHPDDDSDEAHKRPRSIGGSPAPQANGQKSGVKVDASKLIAEARARAAAIAARTQSPAANQAPNGLPAAGAAAPSTISSSVQAKIAEMKARVAAATSRAGGSTTSGTPPQRSAATTSRYQPPQPQYEDTSTRARGGLDVGLHPALMAETQDSKSTKGRQAMQPKFATTMANRRPGGPPPSTKRNKQLDLSAPSLEELKSNPYFDPSLSVKSSSRKSRELIFNEKGKYIQQAAALRRQANLEAMKKRIAESSRRAGIDEDLDTEKAFLVAAPPEIEWWDEGLVNGGNYLAIDQPDGLKIETPDTIVTRYLQHPVALEPPQEKKMPPPKPMFLTQKEQKKKRRQQRKIEHKEQQEKIRLGLEPAPPPKVKKSNLMRVLGEEAVKDPTAVEARVNREIEERHDQHLATNESRKLTKEEKNEKLARQQEQDAAKGIHSLVFRIDSLANGRHRFKISKNAEQNALTGICLLHPKFCLVIVEGGIHSIAAYKKLMLNRVDWTENVAPNAETRQGNKEVMARWLQAEDENGVLKNLERNTCQLIWEGELKDRAFRKWSSRVCDTDKEARDTLSRAKMESFWTVAKNLGSGTS